MSGISSILTSGSLKRAREGEESSSHLAKKARIEDLATAAALEALAGAVSEEPSQEDILNKLEKFPDAYLSLSSDYTESLAFNIEACTKNGLCLQYMDSFYRNKHEIVVAAVKNNPRAISFMSPFVFQGINIVCEALKKDPALISLVNAKYFEHSFDVEPMLKITGIEGFKQAPESAKKDSSLILSLIRSGYKDLLKSLDPALKSSGAFFRELLIDHDSDLSLLDYAVSTYSDDEEFMLSIIDLSEKIADLTSERLKGTKSFLIQALAVADVSSFVRGDLLEDPDILEELIRFKADVYTKFPEDMRNDPDFAIAMLVKNPLVIDHLPNALIQELKQKDHVLDFMRQIKEAASDEAQSDELEKSSALETLGKRWFSNQDFMLEALDIDPQNIIYGTTVLKKNKELIKKIALEAPQYLYLVDQKTLEAPKFMKELVIINPDSIDYIPTTIWSDHKLLKELLKVHPDLLYKFPDELRELKIFR